MDYFGNRTVVLAGLVPYALGGLIVGHQLVSALVDILQPHIRCDERTGIQGALRPELSAQADEAAASWRLRWSHALPGCGSPRLTAPGGASLLPFCSRQTRWSAGGGRPR